ncbi:MAG: hypothetical protein M3Q14_01445 [bacterium]|nr:hypothetical protein [bacterium]
MDQTETEIQVLQGISEAPSLGYDGFPLGALRENWNSVYDLSRNLAEVIRSDSSRRGEQFDAMVVIPRGSYYVANIVSRELGFLAPDILHMCMTSYDNGVTERKEVFQYGQMPSLEEVDGKDLLIIEEVCDSGETIAHASQLLKLAGAGLIRSGALHYKPQRSTTGYKPDWYGITTDAWIVYPWEVNEANGINANYTVKRCDD